MNKHTEINYLAFTDDSANTVSYTHLDVYKRQVIMVHSNSKR